MHVSRGGQLTPYGDPHGVLAETKAGLDQVVRERAYLLWEQAGRPEGRADNFGIKRSINASANAPTRGGSGRAIRRARRTSTGFEHAPLRRADHPVSTTPIPRGAANALRPHSHSGLKLAPTAQPRQSAPRSNARCAPFFLHKRSSGYWRGLPQPRADHGPACRSHRSRGQLRRSNRMI